jgi:hypothetical protein
VDLHIHSPIHLRGVVLNVLSTGTTLPLLPHEDVWGSGCVDPRISALAVVGSDQLHAPTTLPPGMSPWYPQDRTLGGPHNRSWRRE